jgi:hypothetical protein
MRKSDRQWRGPNFHGPRLRPRRWNSGTGRLHPVPHMRICVGTGGIFSAPHPPPGPPRAARVSPYRVDRQGFSSRSRQALAVNQATTIIWHTARMPEHYDLTLHSGSSSRRRPSQRLSNGGSSHADGALGRGCLRCRGRTCIGSPSARSRDYRPIIAPPVSTIPKASQLTAPHAITPRTQDAI